MGALHFSADIDIAKLNQKVSQIESNLNQLAIKAANSGSIMDNSFKKASQSAGILGNDIGSLQRNLVGLASVATLGRLGQEVITIRGEFQQLGIAFETMLGSKEKADKLMQEAIVFAAKTPFTLQDVATNIKQLMAMGIENEKVMATMKSLGDVAAGVSVPISRIAINYGQVATQGKLMSRELRDFNMAGIPLAQELAKNLGVAKDEIAGMVGAGQIGFPEVEKAFQSMSGEGGKFYNLMEKQNKSVTGQISNLTDKLQVMFNEIGKSNEGLIYGGISGVSSVIGNYKEIGDVLMGLVVTYGVYKTALITVNAIESSRIAIIEAKKAAIVDANVAEDLAKTTSIALAQKEAEASAASLVIETSKQTAAAKTAAAKEAAAIATANLIAAEKAYAITAVEASAAYGIGAATEKQILLKKELAEVSKSRMIADRAIQMERNAITAETVLNANIEAAAVKKAEAEKIAATEAGIIAQRDSAIAATVATGAEIRAAQAKKLGAAAQQLLNATMLNNPYVAAAAALGLVVYGLYKYATYQTELEKATTKMNVELEIERDKVNSLFSALKLTTDGTKEHEAAKKKLIETYGDYIPEQNKELKNLQDIKIAQDEVNRSLSENVAIKTRDELKAKISEEASPKIIKGRDNILDKLSGTAKSDVAFMLDQLISQFKLEGTSADKIQEEWKSFYGKLVTIDKSASEGLNARKIQGYFYDMLMPVAKMNDGIKEADASFNKFISDQKKGQAEPPKPEFITAEQERINLRKKLVLETAKLKELESTPSLTPLQDIEDQKAVIKSLKEKLGLNEKQKKAEDELKKAEEDLAEAVKKGDQAAIDSQAKKVAGLQKEYELRKWIAEEAIAFANGTVTQADRDSLKSPKSIVPILGKKIDSKGQLGTNKQGQIIEITAIDKTGPTYKKIGLETGKLKKRAADADKDAADQQKKYDEENAERKEQINDDLLNYSRQFTGELVDQLGLTKEQNEAFQGLADTIFNLVSGNPIAAAFSVVSTFMRLLSGNNQESQKFMVGEVEAEITNSLLERQSSLLEKIAGRSYLSLTIKQMKDLAAATAVEEQKLRGLFAITNGDDPTLNDVFGLNNMTIDQIVEAYGNGVIQLGQAQIDQLDLILEKRKELTDLQGESFSRVLGFDSSTVADSIFQGIEDGLKLSENGLGGFAQSFGDLMKTALSQSILDSLNSDLTSGFMTNFKAFINPLSSGGSVLTDDERAQLEKDYADAIVANKTAYDAMKPILDKYIDSPVASQMNGSIAGASEDTMNLLAGQMMAIRVDVKTNQNIMQNQLEMMDESLSVLNKIESNTRDISRLESIENAVVETNRILNSKL